MFLSHFRHFFAPKKTYFDYASVTPIDKEVLRLMNSVYLRFDKNPSALYRSGTQAFRLLEESRKKVAQALSGNSVTSVHPDEIIFTGGGTSSNNLAIEGVLKKYSSLNKDKIKSGELPHIITSNIEHPSIKNTIEKMVAEKIITATFISVDENGIIDLNELKESLSKNTILVSVMTVSNEIGTIQPLRDISSLIRKHRKDNNTSYPYLHTDACQAPCYLDLQVEKNGVDLLTLDGGKVYGPRGVGCLYIKRGVLIESFMSGGSQEAGLYPGTENLPAIVGFTKALQKVVVAQKKEATRLRVMQEYIYTCLPEKVFVNGTTDTKLRSPNNINICIPESDSEFLVFQFDVAGIELSAVTACQNKQEESRSYVVDALGKSCGGSSLRISLGNKTSWRGIKKLVRVMNEIVK